MIKTFDLFFILISLMAFILGMNRRFRLWRIGKSIEPTGKMGSRLKTLLVEGIAHRRILQDF
jgi:hypothetical protein